MEERYDVYFAGQLKEGADEQLVRGQLARLFNADDKTLDILFSGTPRIIKRDCDRATAQQYKDAMERAGAVPVIKAQVTGSEKPDASEKIAALAATPDDTRYRGDASAPSSTEQTPAPETQGNTEPGNIDLAPPQSDVLRPDERATPVNRDIDTSALAVDTTATRFSEEKSAPSVNLDTDHLSMAEAGADIPNLPSSAAPLSPNTDSLELSAVGTDFSDCVSSEAPPPELDLSGLDIEAPGADMLEEKYRDRDKPPPPSTDHLSLED